MRLSSYARFRVVLGAAASWLALAAGPVPASTLLGLVDTGEIFASTDNGVSWNVHATLPVIDAVGIAAGATSSDLYLATESGTVYRSDDAGAGWTAVGAVPASDVTDMCVRPDEAVLLLTESGVVYVSTDQGASFAAQAALTGSNFVSLAIVSSDSLYALTRTGEVALSADGGDSWSTVGTMALSDAVNIRALESILYVLTGTGGIYRSEDRGSTWTPIATLSQVHMAGFAGDGTQLYAAVREGEVAASSDGVTWTWQGTINQLSVMALGTDKPAVSGVEMPPYRPHAFILGQNYPNPFGFGALITYIPFEIKLAGHVELRVYDAEGRLVNALLADELTANTYTIPWRGFDEEGRAVPAGTYFYELRHGSSISSRKAVVVR
jgi:photosystem II stability/assembly factor-like uncharacterized protein